MSRVYTHVEHICMACPYICGLIDMQLTNIFGEIIEGDL